MKRDQESSQLNANDDTEEEEVDLGEPSSSSTTPVNLPHIKILSDHELRQNEVYNTEQDTRFYEESLEHHPGCSGYLFRFGVYTIRFFVSVTGFFVSYLIINLSVAITILAQSVHGIPLIDAFNIGIVVGVLVTGVLLVFDFILHACEKYANDDQKYKRCIFCTKDPISLTRILCHSIHVIILIAFLFVALTLQESCQYSEPCRWVLSVFKGSIPNYDDIKP